MKLQWHPDQFRVVPMNLTDIEMEQYVYYYIMHMFDTRLLSNSTINKEHLRWLSLLEDFDV